MQRGWKKIWKTNLIDPDTLTHIWRGMTEDGRIYRVFFCPKCGKPLRHNSINEMEGYHIYGCDEPSVEEEQNIEDLREMEDDEE